MTAGALVREIAAAHGVTVRALRSPFKTCSLTAARAHAARKLRAKFPHLSNAAIGRMIGRTSWTVRYHVDAAFRARKLAQFRERDTKVRA